MWKKLRLFAASRTNAINAIEQQVNNLRRQTIALQTDINEKISRYVAMAEAGGRASGLAFGQAAASASRYSRELNNIIQQQQTLNRNIQNIALGFGSTRAAGNGNDARGNYAVSNQAIPSNSSLAQQTA